MDALPEDQHVCTLSWLTLWVWKDYCLNVTITRFGDGLVQQQQGHIVVHPILLEPHVELDVAPNGYHFPHEVSRSLYGLWVPAHHHLRGQRDVPLSAEW